MTADDLDFAALSREITKTSGFALDAYKDKCIRRRIAVRMRACGVHTYEDYRMLLKRSPNEYERLRDALTINVTRFYRNAETWNLLRRDVLPALFDRRRGEVRVWSAGCSSGEEPYTLAVLAADHLDRAGRGDELSRLTIDATDIDRISLDRAQAAAYRSEGLTEMPDDLVRPYFEPAGDERRVIDRVRRRVAGPGARPEPRGSAPDQLRSHSLPQRRDLLRPDHAGATVSDVYRARWCPAGISCWGRSRPSSAPPASVSP